MSAWLRGVPRFSWLLQYPPKIAVLHYQGSKLVGVSGWEDERGELSPFWLQPTAELNEVSSGSAHLADKIVRSSGVLFGGVPAAPRG